MPTIGVSTGAVSLSDFRLGMEIARRCGVSAIELSALREEELGPLMSALPTLDLAPFQFVSVHAPSCLSRMDEQQLRLALEPAFQMNHCVILHADVIKTPSLWRDAGAMVCVENMDLRKRTGQTTKDMLALVEQLPDASICFDIGHARQVDRTMTEATLMVQCLRERIVEIHISEVNHHGTHLPLTAFSVRSFRQLARLLPDVPAILETPSDESTLPTQMMLARRALEFSEELLPAG